MPDPYNRLRTSSHHPSPLVSFLGFINTRIKDSSLEALDQEFLHLFVLDSCELHMHIQQFFRAHAARELLHLRLHGLEALQLPIHQLLRLRGGGSIALGKLFQT